MSRATRKPTTSPWRSRTYGWQPTLQVTVFVTARPQIVRGWMRRVSAPEAGATNWLCRLDYIARRTDTFGAAPRYFDGGGDGGEPGGGGGALAGGATVVDMAGADPYGVL